MKDLRIIQMAGNLLHYSVELKAGESILIELYDSGEELASELIKEVYRIGGKPYLSVKSRALLRELILGTDAELMSATARYEAERMKDMHAYIGIRGALNSSDWSDIPSEKMRYYQLNWSKPVHLDIRVPKTKWCVMRYPNDSMAQMANMSTEQFENFYFNVCNLDYAKMSKSMDPLIELMEKTDRVRIKGAGTDLSFSIKGLPAIKCDGKFNIPDGEVYSAPVKDSVNGYITYNTQSEYQGYTYENIRLEFKDGKIINATANDTEKINKVFDIDEGARYVGEFALGVNPYIIKPMKDTLFDEKIMGSFHFTPGDAYDKCFNGNKSAIHWDLVNIQTPEYGGGEIWFDDVLIRKDGKFVLKELDVLNPEKLK
ncbi:MAG TPA: aminopeptidase [Bacillota bacterium]|nr:aminopeptidase [Bacillota bacterium]HOR85444.1 aminopeptidase [Bacillota bacterium]HPL52836.1 aminopeptidase [Bacillota bacterium]